jgi:Protein of unknown function (DUF2934)
MLPQDHTKSAAADPKPASAKDAKGATTKTAATRSIAGIAPRKPGTGRPNDDLQQRIQQRAYELWEHEGRPHGRAHAHWQQAEREIAAPGASARA